MPTPHLVHSAGNERRFWTGFHHISGLFELMRHLQKKWFLEHVSNQLHANGQSPGVEAARDADGWESREIGGNGQQIRELHRQGVIRMGTVLEGRAWSGGREQHVH